MCVTVTKTEMKRSSCGLISRAWVCSDSTIVVVTLSGLGREDCVCIWKSNSLRWLGED